MRSQGHGGLLWASVSQSVKGGMRNGMAKVFVRRGLFRMPGLQVPLRPFPFGGSGGAQERAQAGHRKRTGPEQCRLPPPGGVLGPRSSCYPVPPAGRRTAFSGFFFLSFFPSLHSCLINSLPSFSQIYQHLAFAWTHSQPQTLSPGEEQIPRGSFLRGWGVGKRRCPP